MRRKERQNAFLLSAGVAFAVFVMFLIVAITEQGPAAGRFAWATVVMLAVSGCLFLAWFVDVTLESRPSASESEYRRLKRRVYKELKKHPHDRQLKVAFIVAAKELGVNGIAASSDFDELERRARRW